jgi:HK97 gp10 family phage protein
MSRVKDKRLKAMFRTLERLPFEACKIGQSVAQQKAPVASGKLRDSIKVSSSVANPNAIEAALYTRRPYAPIVELGSPTQPAQPFMAPAFTRMSYHVTRTLNKL